MKRFIAIGFACVVATASACDRNIEPYVEGEQATQPDLAKMFPETDNGPRGETLSQMADTARTGSMPSPASAASVEATGGSITGRIEVSGDLLGEEPAGATLFVIARRGGAKGGPPLAVLRVPNAAFPLDFEIGPQHAMIQGMPFAGDIALSARLDADGDAMTKVAGDLSGAVAAPLKPGATGVALVLDAKL